MVKQYCKKSDFNRYISLHIFIVEVITAISIISVAPTYIVQGLALELIGAIPSIRLLLIKSLVKIKTNMNIAM